MQKDPMLNEDFLRALSEFNHQFVWTKIVSLTLDEDPIEEITGRVSNGSINIDGSSAVRRTCSLTLVAKDVNINDYYWSLKTKFKVYIGLENHINNDYPDIIWFKQGIFLISSFSCSAGINNYTISIQGKDKMSLLNGDFGGVIPSSWDFGTMDETLKDGSIKNTQIPIKDIVFQAVHEYAQEPWQNIIVNDLDDYGIELLEYQGTTPFYYIIDATASGDNDSREVAQMVFNPDLLVSVELVDWVNNKPKSLGWTDFDVKISEIEKIVDTGKLVAAGASNPPIYSYEKLLEQLDPSGNVTETKNYYRARIKLKDSDTVYTVAKIERDNGLQVCGYRICDIVYPYDLIGSPGETITSILDKLVQMLGNFEYFYDVDGRFIFQRKRTYLDVTYNNIIGEHDINKEIWVEDKMYNSKYSFVFDENTLISSIQNTPNIANIKNDYSLWGSRKSGDREYPIHMRYAIDHKPMWYKTINDGLIYATEEGLKEYTLIKDEYIKETNQELVNQLQQDKKHFSYTKTRNTNGLSEDWWEVQDWARYYAIIAILKEGKVPEDFTQEELEELYYPKNWLTYYKSTAVENLPSYSDVAKAIGGTERQKNSNSKLQMIIQQPDGNWTTHGWSCSHSYFQFIPGFRKEDENGQVKRYYDAEHNKYSPMAAISEVNEGTHVYIYKPSFPGELSYESTQSSPEDPIIIDLSNYYPDKDTYKIVDWREIIYQMAQDYRRYYRDDDFLINVRENNRWTPRYSIYPKGYTGYEKYYVDFEMNLSQGVVAYWRELYNPEAANENNENVTGRYEVAEGGKVNFIADNTAPIWNSEVVYKKGDYVRYREEDDQQYNVYLSLANNNTDIPNSIKTQKWIKKNGDFVYNSNGWNINVLNNPEILNFWFDFLDGGDGSDINKYSVNNIGQRTKAANDSTIKSIYFRETPNVIFDFGDEDIQKKWLKPGYSYIKIPNLYKGIFTISSRGKNAMDVVEDYLYQYAYPINAISFNSVPIYYLTPNTLIYLNDKDTGVVGEYILQKYSIQLGFASQMNVSAIQTTKRLY